jgi:hypothetical protein
MSYEALEEAREIRAPKGKALAEKSKGKRGRKRKATIREDQEIASSLVRKDKVARSEDQDHMPLKAAEVQMC